FAGAGFLVQPLRITAFADFQRRVDEDFDKVPCRSGLLDLLPRPLAIAAVRTDEGCDRDQASGDEQLADRSDAANIFLPIFGRKPEAESLRQCLAVLIDQPLRRRAQAVAD